MPKEDPTIAWISPFIKIADVKIPPQVFDTPAQKEFDDNLSFDIWHSLPEHRSPGNFNRARKQAYEQLSKFRHEHNQLPILEPIVSSGF